MTWNSSARKRELPSNWAAIREDVFDQKGRRCFWVEKDGKRCNAVATHIDHIQRGNDHRLANLQPLCEPHHRLKTSLEGKEARYKLAPRRGKLFEPHPGLKQAE